MSPTDPRHGTYAGYVAGCKCEPCCLARFRYDKRTAMLRLQGETLTVPIDRARAHIAHCVDDLGMPYAAFRRVGIPRSERIHRGEHQFIHRSTERRVLAVQPIPGVNWFPTWGARRRLRALVALGHTQKVLAEALEVPEQHMSDLVTGNRGMGIEPELWSRIAAVYDEWSMRLGTSVQSRNRARANGWATPLAFDDIDDPDERPTRTRANFRDDPELDEAAIWRRMHGDKTVRLTKADAAEVVERCLAAGWAWAVIEQRTGINVQQHRERRAG